MHKYILLATRLLHILTANQPETELHDCGCELPLWFALQNLLTSLTDRRTN